MDSKFISALGTATALYFFLKLLRFIHLYTRPSSLDRYLHGDSPWALVTGASDGIGRGFARELAKKGFNVVIHGRSPTKLKNVKTQIAQEFPKVKCRIAVADASFVTNKEIEELAASFSDIRITVLINNVGGGVKVQTLEESSAEEVDSALNINARFPAQFTRAMLPKLTSTPGPKLIMNIGSLADIGSPYVVVYLGSKAFNTSMSSSLSVELRVEGKLYIEVIAIPVRKVVETVHMKDPVTFFSPGARTMAKAALQRVGCGRPVVVGYFGHALQKALIDIMPLAVFEALAIPTIQKLYKEEKKRSKCNESEHLSRSLW